MRMITRKDLIIIAYMRKNSRTTLTRMAKRTRTPISTVYEKLKLLKKDIIKKNTAIVDFAKIGYYARAKFVVKAKITRKKELLNYLKNHRSVNSLYTINNGYDFLFEGIFRNMKELEDFVEKLKSSSKCPNAKFTT